LTALSMVARCSSNITANLPQQWGQAHTRQAVPCRAWNMS
jgi:hypothetical protein